MKVKHKITPFGLGALAAAGIFLLLLLLPLPIKGSGRVFHAWWDFAHVPAFTCISLGVITLLRAGTFSRAQRQAAGLVTLLTVPGIEFVQGHLGREQSAVDLAYGLIGCALGGALFVSSRGSSRFARAARPLAALLGLGAMAYPVLLWGEDRRIERMFPVVSAFDSPLEQTRWNIHGCAVKMGQGWEVTVRDDVKHPRLALLDKRQDWSAATGLGLDVVLHGNDPLDMTVVMDDAPGVQPYDNHFRQTVRLTPGTNNVRFERATLERKISGQPMNLQTVSGLGLYFSRSDAGRRLRLTKIFLETDRN
jgi:VanZ family protein